MYTGSGDPVPHLMPSNSMMYSFLLVKPKFKLMPVAGIEED